MPEHNVIAAMDETASAAAPAGREPFVAPCVEDLGGLSTLTLIGGSL